MVKQVLAKKEDFPWLKKYPSEVPWSTEIPYQPLYKLFDQAAKKFSTHSLMDFLGKKYTYGETAKLVNKVAKGLQSLGIKKGDRIGLFMPNAPYYIIFYYAILKAGGIVVNFNPLYVASEIHHQIDDSGVEIVVTLDLQALCEKLFPQLHKTTLKKIIICPLKDALPFPKNILLPLLKRKELAHIPKSNDIIYLNELLNNDGNYRKIKIIPEKDIAVIQYTGGTTGSPKGAMLSHRNIYSNAIQCLFWVGDLIEFGQEKSLAALPFFHVFAMTTVMNFTIHVGGEIIIMFPRFNVEEAMKLIEKKKITCFPAVPTIYTLINNHKDIDKFNLHTLKTCICGGAPLPVEVKKEFERLTGGTLVEGYGLSETSPVACANPMKGLNKPGSIGLPLPQTYIKIMSLDDKTKEVPLGEKGEVAIKGPQVMLGYWNQVQETSQTMIDDFFYTGDVGYMDEEGYTFLVDRLKDMVIVNGYNVYPRNVEDAIYKHPAVEEVTVIGAPDITRGEIVKAFIKLKAGMALKASELQDFLQDKLSPIEMPKQIEFRKELPKTLIGKLSKKELVAEEHEAKFKKIKVS